MDGSTAVWLAMTIAAPVTLVPKVALMRMLHARRSAWQPLDILIVSLLVGQLCCTILTFGISAAALIRQAGLWSSVFFLGSRTPLCAVLICGWAAAHTLHAATLTSLAVDRAMTVRWPYKYRLSVRRTQLRYHVVVLAIISLLVGVAALFASSGTGATDHQIGTNPIRPVRPLDIDDLATADRNPADELIDADVSNSSLFLDADYEALVGVSGFNGVARDGCTFLPYLFDARFSLFWLCLHGVLFVATVAAVMVIIVTWIVMRCGRGSTRLGSGSDMRTLGNVSEGSSATLPLPLGPPPPPPRYTPTPIATIHSFGGHFSDAPSSPLGRSNQNLFGSSDKTYVNLLHHDPKMVDHPAEYGGHMEPASNRQRHSTVAAVLIVAYLTYHLPLLVLTTLGTYFDTILPDWPFSAMVLGLGLAHSLLFMVLLVFIDPHVHAWMIDSLRPKSLRPRNHQRVPMTPESATLEPALGTMKIDEDARYRMSQLYAHEPTESKFPLTNGSLFVHLMNPPCSEGTRGRERRTSRMGISAYERHHRVAGAPNTPVYPETKPPLLTFMSRSQILASNGMKSQVEPLYSDPMPGTMITASAASSPLKMRRSEPIYATLSETMSSCNTTDSLGQRQPTKNDDYEDEGSATESAGDDFEFHNIRSSRQTLISQEEEQNPHESSSSVGGSPQFTAADLKPRSRVARSATYRILCNGLDVKCAKRGESQSKLTASSLSQHGIVTCVAIQDGDDSFSKTTLRQSKLLTSLSMNDLDMVGEEEETPQQQLEPSMTRSDSLFSLFQVQVPVGVENREINPPAIQVTKETEESHVEDGIQGRTGLAIRSSIELSKSHYNDGGRRKRLNRNLVSQSHERHQGMLHFRKKSINRSRAAMLQRYQDRSSSTTNDSHLSIKNSHVVTIASLQAALSDSPRSYLDNGDIFSTAHQERTVFVSEYI